MDSYVLLTLGSQYFGQENKDLYARILTDTDINILHMTMTSQPTRLKDVEA
jgi:hypothetical protein